MACAKFISRVLPVEELFKLGARRQSCACAECAAFHCRDRVAKFQTGFHVRAREKAIKNSAVKRVAGAGRVTATTGRSVPARFNKGSFGIDDCARRADRHADYGATKSLVEFNECRAFVSDPGDTLRKFFRADENVDQRQ